MSWQSGRRLLVLGGIRSGKSELAEQLVSDAAAVRYVATATGSDDPTWQARIAAHRERRPAGWSVEEIGSDPRRLVTLLAEAKPDETLLVDDLGGWLTATLDAAGAWDDDTRDTLDVPSLAAAVRDCPAAALVLVSPEVGLTVVAPTAAGRLFTDRIGEVNRAVADACDAVAFVVAGQPTWVKGTDPRGARGQAGATPAGTRTPVAGPVRTAAPVATDGGATVATPAPEPESVVVEPESVVAEPAVPAWSETDTMMLPAVDGGTAALDSGTAALDSGTAASGTATGAPAIAVGMRLPMPDEDASAAAGERLVGFGALTPVVRFTAGVQGQPVPRPWQNVRMLLLHADHDGGVAAGDSPAASAQRLDAAERGEGPVALLAGAAGAAVQTVRCPGTGGAIEEADALPDAEVDAALGYGWQLADSAVDAGTDLIVLGSCGAGAEATATAVIATTANGEAAALLGRVIGPDGRIDDLAWMRRCGAVRDALHRVRSRPRDPRAVLATLGGADLAVATGVLLGAVSRRTPVMLDGPVGVAAALVARDFGAQTRHWLLLPDTGGHPAVRLGAEVLGVTPVLDLKLGLGEGATALAALPLLRSALTLAATLPGA